MPLVPAPTGLPGPAAVSSASSSQPGWSPWLLRRQTPRVPRPARYHELDRLPCPLRRSAALRAIPAKYARSLQAVAKPLSKSDDAVQACPGADELRARLEPDPARALRDGCRAATKVRQDLPPKSRHRWWLRAGHLGLRGRVFSPHRQYLIAAVPNNQADYCRDRARER